MHDISEHIPLPQKMLTKIDQQKNKPPWKWHITYDNDDTEGVDELDHGSSIRYSVLN